jgi:uncharacterized protein (TIGR00369 family)
LLIFLKFLKRGTNMNPMDKIASMFPDTFTLPPHCFAMADGRILDWQPGISLKASFPVRESYENPAGVMQGGFIAAMVDNTFGPFSFLEAKKPTSTLEMNFTYVRPVVKGMKKSS